MIYANNPATSGLQSTGQFMINPEEAFQGKQGASSVLGKLYRAQWDDWKSRFKPYIGRLADKATSEGFIGEQSSQAAGAVGTAYDNVNKGMATQRQGMGISLTPAQQQAEQRKMSLAQSADTNAAYNNARISARDLQDQMLSGGMGLNNVPNTNQ
jgi:hypothetical protein